MSCLHPASVTDRSEPSQVEETGSAECRSLIRHGELTVEQDTRVVANR